MPKPAAHLLEPGTYPFRCELMTRFQDLDINQHINNVAFAALLEDTRVRFDAAIGLHAIRDELSLQFMIASLSVEYLAQAYYPDAISGLLGVSGCGRTSWSVAGILLQGAAVPAFTRATLVCTREGQPIELPEPFRAALEANRIAA